MKAADAELSTVDISSLHADASAGDELQQVAGHHLFWVTINNASDCRASGVLTDYYRHLKTWLFRQSYPDLII